MGIAVLTSKWRRHLASRWSAQAVLIVATVAGGAGLLAACGDGNGLDLDPTTQRTVADALWMPSFDSAALPPEVKAALASPKNQPANVGARMVTHLDGLLANPSEMTPDYTRVYGLLKANAKRLSGLQNYAMSNLLGLDSVNGYQPLPPGKNFRWPADDRVQTEYQTGWHFFVGSVVAETGQEFGVQLMFWSQSLLPPAQAAAMGLTPAENLASEMHLAVTPVGGRHYRAQPTAVVGTSGLVKLTDDPVSFELGRNFMRAQSAKSFFPLQLRAQGVDRTQKVEVPIGLNLTLRQTKPYVLNGDEGMSPSCDGVGTLYYSVPSLQVDPTGSVVEWNGQSYKIAHGKLWYDHQWGNGFMPDGNVQTTALRAYKIAGAARDKSRSGWDWMFAAFDDGTEITLSALHTSDFAEFYDRTDTAPPAKVMTVPASGAYIDRDGVSHKTSATIRVTEWVKGTHSQGPYQAKGVWYPNRVEVTVSDPVVPADKRSFTLRPIVSGGQQGFFGVGMEYSEGAVFVEQGARTVGRGFLESTGYANSLSETLKLAGLPQSPDVVASFASRNQADADLLKRAAAYALSHPLKVSTDPSQAGKPGVVVCRGATLF